MVLKFPLDPQFKGGEDSSLIFLFLKKGEGGNII